MNRYLISSYGSKALEKNALQISPNRKFHIYLPPDYHENTSQRYPVIYFLHGYGGNIDGLIIISKKQIKKQFPLLFRLLLPKFFKNFPTFEVIDQKIKEGVFPPFILVQPDGSMGIKAKFELKNDIGIDQTKGSFYVNSPHTGNFGDSIFIDLIKYVDENFRTIPDKTHRAIMGASMGGYGALFAAMNYPNLFNSAVSLSPVITPYELLNHHMIVPLFARIYGKKKALRQGDKELVDILDTIDLIFSPDSRLVPEDIDPSNRKFNLDNQKGIENWTHSDLVELLNQKGENLSHLKLLINCEESDEFNLAYQVKNFHEKLNEMNIPHHSEIYKDEFAAKVSPHQVGISSKIMDGIKFSLDAFKN
ncbi:MAG: alpha/beta hydrolase [Promethearchaeota archaeon]|nr:MAG: alpha/beta hydrolase [Candidatus Lokiarchaeota archaeon]